MKKHPTDSKLPRSNLTSVDQDPALASLVLPRTLPRSTQPVKPDAVADSELDPPVEGLDPTLPVNPVRGAPGHQIKEPPVDEEDEDGRSVGEQLVEKGVSEAEQDTANQGGRKRSR
jgi:hypothetical protein